MISCRAAYRLLLATIAVVVLAIVLVVAVAARGQVSASYHYDVTTDLATAPIAPGVTALRGDGWHVRASSYTDARIKVFAICGCPKGTILNVVQTNSAGLSAGVGGTGTASR